MAENAIIAALGRLQAGQNDIKTNLAAMTENQAAMTANMAAMKESQIELRTALMARMDRLENKFSSLRDDIAVNFGAVDAVKRANDNTREELRNLGDMVTAMMRKVNRLET